MYTLAWFVLSCGFTFIIAAAFFGFPQDKEPVTKEKDLKCPVTGGRHIITTIWSRKDNCHWSQKVKENQDDT